MGLVYLDTWMVDIYGECRQYRSPIDPSWVTLKLGEDPTPI